MLCDQAIVDYYNQVAAERGDKTRRERVERVRVFYHVSLTNKLSRTITIFYDVWPLGSLQSRGFDYTGKGSSIFDRMANDWEMKMLAHYRRFYSCSGSTIEALIEDERQNVWSEEPERGEIVIARLLAVLEPYRAGIIAKHAKDPKGLFNVDGSRREQLSLIDEPDDDEFDQSAPQQLIQLTKAEVRT